MRVLLGPSRAELTEATGAERAFVRETLSVEVPGARFTRAARRGWDGVHRFLKLGKFFPAGLAYLVQKKLPKGMAMEVDYAYDWPEKGPSDLHGYAMAGKWAFQAEVVRRALYHGRGLVWTATNSGKTVIMAALAKAYKTSVLILVHRVEIFRQIKELLAAALREPIGTVAAGDVNLAGKRVAVAMVKTLYQRLLDEESVVCGFFDRVQVVMADECHHISCPTYQFVFERSAAPIRFGFSGTIPPENTYEGMMIRAATGPVIARVTNKELVNGGISAVPVVRGVWCRHPNLPSFAGLRGTALFRAVERSAIVEDGARNAMIVELLRKNKDVGVVVVVSLIEHGRRITEAARAAGVGPVEFIHGTSSNREVALSAFKRGALKALVSSEIIDEGVDTDQIRVLVMAAGRKSPRQVLQRFGRGMRAKVRDNVLTVWELLDDGHKFLRKHALARKAIYEGEGFAVRDATV